MMSDAASAKLHELQARFETDATEVRTRSDLIRLRMYWNDINEILALDGD